MTIHKEGYKIIAISVFVFGVINLVSFTFLSEPSPWLAGAIFIASLGLLLFIISFFRIPARHLIAGDNKVVSPADGKVVAIEEVMDNEYFHDRRIQVSIFMSPSNVHVNRYPINGVITYSHYHPGKYLVAWHAKSSLENERHSVVIQNGRANVLVKQIAGALAKRICNYAVVGQPVQQGSELGFIKFGSRVDVLLPLDAAIKVRLSEPVKGGVSVLATL